MSKCPYCDYETPESNDPRVTAWAEISHMIEIHPDIVRKRLRDAGIHPNEVYNYPYEEEKKGGV